MKKIITVALIICVCFTMTSCNKNGLEYFFADWEPEYYDPSIAFVNLFTGEIEYAGGTVNIINCLEEHFYRHHSITCLAMIDNTLFYTLRHASGEGEYFRRMEIRSVNLTDFTTEVLYTHNCSPTHNPDSIIDPKSYYYDHNIYIYDGVTVGIFNIDTQTAESREADDFIPPTMTKYLVKHNDYSYIKVVGDSFERKITYEYLAERNEYASRLEKIHNEWPKSIFLGGCRMGSFFQSASVIDDIIYLRCTVQDADGEDNCIIFSYNCENDAFKFLHHSYMGFDGEDFAVDVIPVE